MNKDDANLNFFLYRKNQNSSSHLDAALKKGLRYDAERRFDDVSEFLHELQQSNPKYEQQYRAILWGENPLRFWQYLAAGLFAAFCTVSYFLLRKILG